MLSIYALRLGAKAGMRALGGTLTAEQEEAKMVGRASAYLSIQEAKCPTTVRSTFLPFKQAVWCFHSL